MSISGSYSSYRGTLVYKDYTGAIYTRSLSGTNGGSVTVTDSASTSNYCNAIATASVSFTIASGFSFNGTTAVSSNSCSYEIGDRGHIRTNTVYAQVKEARITNLEVYR